MRLAFILLVFSLITNNLLAKTPQELVKELSLNPAKKAAMQWERIFKSKRKMKRYKIYKISDKEKKILKEYLIEHAADSDKPQFAGEI